MIKDICNNGPQILFIISILLFLYMKNINILLIYIIGYILNILINRVLRNIIKDKRLTENGNEKYNMPSGHSQAIFFSLVFVSIFLIKKNQLLYYLIILFYTILSVGTASTCIIYNYHTCDQVLVGGFIGGILAYIILYLYMKL